MRNAVLQRAHRVHSALGINMRTLFCISFIAVAACATNSNTDDTDQQDPSVGKADASSKPSGTYTNPTPTFGSLASVTLNVDMTFSRSELVLCAGGGTCPPAVTVGTFLFTHSTTTTRKYIRFYDESGNALDRYTWKLTSAHNLELEAPDASEFVTFDAGGTCESAGGSCVALSPGSCDVGSVGDATQYSCGGGLGVECCLPPAADNSCSEASDCSGALPDFCRVCSDGSESCAHWACDSGTCQIESCPS